MVTIVVDQYLSNIEMYEQICLENIKKLYKSALKSDAQHQYKEIVESAMVSTPEEFTENSPMSSSQSVTMKKTSTIKSLRQFFYILEFKPNTDVRRFCAPKSKCKSIRTGSVLRSSISKRRIHKKINKQVKKYPYNCIIQHPQVAVFPIENHCIKLSIYVQVASHSVLKLLLHV